MHTNKTKFGAKSMVSAIIMSTCSVGMAADVTGDRLDIGRGHTLTGTYATIAGGETNKATTNYAVVSGGFLN